MKITIITCIMSYMGLNLGPSAGEVISLQIELQKCTYAIIV